MKKLLFTVAIFVTVLANATNDKEIVMNQIETTNLEKEVSLAENLSEYTATVSEISDGLEEEFFGCGSSGNSYYNILRSENPDMSHREARAARRAFVRDCRGGPVWVPWPWE